MNPSSENRGRSVWWKPDWVGSYQRGHAAQDLVAGLVVTVLLVPQSMAYALLAGLPPHMGMYASILPLLAYAWLGSSMTLAVGPVAVAALMTASAVGQLASPGTAEYVQLSMHLAMIGGLGLLLFGVFRMGFMANLLSHSVIGGFITGAAILIVVGQLKPLLGIDAPSSMSIMGVHAVIMNMSGIKPATAIVGVSAGAVLWLAKSRLSTWLAHAGLAKAPADTLAKLAPMAVVLLSAWAVAVFDLDHRYGVEVVGSIPSGLPVPVFNVPSYAEVQALLVPALLIAVVGFVESVSVAQSLGIKRNERIDPNKELRGLGLANIASSVSGGFPVTGGFARSVVNFSAGARTPVAGVVSAILMSLVLVGFTDLFQRLPLAVLAATIVIAVSGLIDTATFRRAWDYDRADALAYLATCAGTLTLGVEAGIGIGIGLSIGVFLWRASRPHIAVLGRLGRSEHFRNVDRYSVTTSPQVLILRIDENLFFANVSAVLDRIQGELANRPDTRHLVLALASVSHVDLTALEAIERMVQQLKSAGVMVHLAEVKGPVLDRLKKSALLNDLPNAPFMSVHQAVNALCHSG